MLLVQTIFDYRSNKLTCRPKGEFRFPVSLTQHITGQCTTVNKTQNVTILILDTARHEALEGWSQYPISL